MATSMWATIHVGWLLASVPMWIFIITISMSFELLGSFKIVSRQIYDTFCSSAARMRSRGHIAKVMQKQIRISMIYKTCHAAHAQQSKNLFWPVLLAKHAAKRTLTSGYSSMVSFRSNFAPDLSYPNMQNIEWIISANEVHLFLDGWFVSAGVLLKCWSLWHILRATMIMMDCGGHPFEISPNIWNQKTGSQSYHAFWPALAMSIHALASNNW